MPQPLTGLAEAEDDDPFAATANTDSCAVNFLPWHLGHSGFSLPYTNVSNSWSHFSQTYSKMGMTLVPSAQRSSLSIRINLW